MGKFDWAFKEFEKFKLPNLGKGMKPLFGTGEKELEQAYQEIARERFGDKTGVEYVSNGNGGICFKVKLPDGRVYLHKLVPEKENSISKESELLGKLSPSDLLPVLEERYETVFFGNRAEVICLDYSEGNTMEKLIAGKRLSPGHVGGIAAAVYSALEILADEEIIHRDVKPANIIVPEHRDDLPTYSRLIDFGLATDTVGILDLEVGKTVGSPSYLSPEQARGDYLEPMLSDLFSLGSFVYEGIVGCKLFGSYSGNNIAGVIKTIADSNLKKGYSSHYDIEKKVNTEFADAWVGIMNRDPYERKKVAKNFKDQCLILYARNRSTLPNLNLEPVKSHPVIDARV